MAQAFKNFLDESLLRCAAAHLRRSWGDFPVEQFLSRATDGLSQLELKQRVRQIAAALMACLPDDFGTAAAILERSLAPARDESILAKLQPDDLGLAGWIVWPMTEFVAQRGLAQPQRALACLHALTQRATAEFALRPFLVEHEALTLRTLRRWVTDPSAHVRRLVSEGSRPRLPWGMRLQRFVADPSPTLPLLAALQDDPSDYVRRSVANHLNDIAKDHPEVVADWLHRHLPTAPPARRAMLAHASRTLLKRGDRAVLAAWGLDRPLRGSAALAIAPSRARSGTHVELQVRLRSTSPRAQRLRVDYLVHHPKRRGTASAKVWRGWQLELAPRGDRLLTKRHSLRPVTTRIDRPGHHAVELLVNGRRLAVGGFELLPAAEPR